MFTLKDTGETMSYDQVRQYLMENPDIWLGAKEGKEVAMPKGETKPLSAEQELSQAFKKWKESFGKMGIIFDPAKPPKDDIEFFNAIRAYVVRKFNEGAYSVKQFIKDLIEEGIPDVKEQQKVWERFYDESIPSEKSEGKKEAPKPPKPPVTPPPTQGKEMPEGEKMERGFVTSIKEATDIREDVKEALIGGRSTYTRLPNIVSVREANAILNAIGIEEAKKLITAVSSDIPFAFRTTLGQVLIKRLNEEEKFKEAVNVVEDVAELSTGLAQGLQALSLLQYLTPAGQLLAAQRDINKIRQKKFSEHEDQIKKLKAQLEALNKQIVEQAINNVSDKTQDVATPESQPKGYGESNKIVTKSAFNKALERLRQAKFFTGVPPELIEIAIYHIEAGSREFGEFSRKMVQTVGKKVKPYLKSAYRAAQKRLGGEGYSSDADIATYMTKDIDKDIVSVLRQSGEKIQEIIRQHYTVAEEVKQTLSEKLQKKLGLSKKDADAIQKAVSTEFDKLATEKKEKAVGSIYKRLARKKPISKTASQRLIEFSNLGAFDEKTFKEEYAKAMGFPELTEADAKKIKELADKVQNAPEGAPKQKAITDLLNYRQTIGGVSLLEKSSSLFVAALLSGAETQSRNLFGNAFNLGLSVLNIGLQSLENPKQLPFLLQGLTYGIAQGALEGTYTLTTGYPPFKGKEDVSAILELVNFYGGRKNPFNYYKYVNRMQLAVDALFYEPLKEMRARQFALTQARNEFPDQNAIQKAIELVNEGDDAYKLAQQQAKEEYEAEIKKIESDKSLKGNKKRVQIFNAKLERVKRVRNILEQSRGEQLVSEATDFGLRNTFNNPPEGLLGVLAQAMNFVTNRLPLVKFEIPFVNVITNAANMALDYTPVGLVRMMRGGSITGNLKKPLSEQEKANLRVRAMTGLTVMFAAFLLSEPIGDDDEPIIEITADGYNDYQKNEDLEKTGWRPYSIKIGDKWWSYKLTPLIGVLGLVGAYRDQQKYHKAKIDQTTSQRLGIAAAISMSTILETSFLSSAETFLSGLMGFALKNDKGEKMKEWATKKATAFVPVLGTNFYQQIAKAVQQQFDIPDKEYKGTYWGRFLRFIPVARDMYENSVNGLGEELPPKKAGILYSVENKGPYAKLWNLLAEKNSNTGKPDRRGASYIDKDGNQKAMNDEQFYFFSKQRGEYLRTLMMVNYDNLKNMDVKEFADWMENARKGANSYANGELALRDEKQIYEKSLQKYEGESNHEKSKVIYAIEANDVKSGRSAYKKYLSLTTKDEDDASKDIFTKIVSDSDILPKGISADDKQSFYEGLFEGNDEAEITIKKENAEGQVEETTATFKEVFSPAQREKLINLYKQKAASVAPKLKKMDEIMGTEYSEDYSGPAIWRQYITEE